MANGRICNSINEENWPLHENKTVDFFPLFKVRSSKEGRVENPREFSTHKETHLVTLKERRSSSMHLMDK